MDVMTALQNKWVHAAVVGVAAAAPLLFAAAGIAEPSWVQAILALAAMGSLGHAVASSAPKV